MLQNPSLETASSNSVPTCWLLGGYGTNTFTWTRTSDAHTGGFAEKLDVKSWTNGDRKLLSAQDNGACAPAAVPGHTYTVASWYKAGSGSPIIYAFYRTSTGSWQYWAQSPKFAISTTWRQASWATPALPAGATAISVGMGLGNPGSVTMDDFALSDNTPPPDTSAPTSTISCGAGLACSSGWYTAPVVVTLSASDTGGSGLKEIRYTTDGSEPSATSGTVYSGAFTVSATATVKYRAFDKAGNAEPAKAQLLQVDAAAPSSTIACNGGVCQSVSYIAAVSVTLSASDTGGSGLKEIRYTTDGSEPSATNGTVYSGAFTVSATATVKYRAFDKAGNAEPVKAQLIQIETPTYFETLPPDSPLPRSDAYCASLVTSNPWEPRPDNYPANLTVPTGLLPWSMTEDELYWTKWIAKRSQVTGNYIGTTDQILRWAACKWGIDENTLRAVAVQESDWHQGAIGDNGHSFGLMQVKDSYADGSPAYGGYPWTQLSTALNVDFYGANLRSCLDGDFYDGGPWLYGGEQIKGDLWGCVGAWFSGSWYDPGALGYIASVKGWLAAKTWLTY